MRAKRMAVGFSEMRSSGRFWTLIVFLLCIVSTMSSSSEQIGLDHMAAAKIKAASFMHLSHVRQDTKGNTYPQQETLDDHAITKGNINNHNSPVLTRPLSIASNKAVSPLTKSTIETYTDDRRRLSQNTKFTLSATTEPTSSSYHNSSSFYQRFGIANNYTTKIHNSEDGLLEFSKEYLNALSSSKNKSDHKLMPLTNRQRYVTAANAYVVMNNHQPRPYSLQQDNTNHWVLSPENYNSKTTIRPFTQSSNSDDTSGQSPPNFITSELTVVLDDYQNISPRPTTLVYQNLMVAQRPKNSTNKSNRVKATTIKPKSKLTYFTTRYPTTTLMPTVSTTPITYNFATQASSRPQEVSRPAMSSMSSLMAAGVMTLASFIRSSFMGTLLVLIPSAIITMALL